jgi:hypothetical protein
MQEASVLERLERWYRSQCNGDWEHGEGVEITTLDNPGWSIRISLADTDLQTRALERIEIDRSEDDWLRAWVDDDVWNAATGPLNLTEALGTFLAWAST